MFNSIYHMKLKITLKLHFWCETDFVIIFVRLLWTPYDELYIKQ